MKLRQHINDRYELYCPDVIADWDAPSAWEVKRIAHMRETLKDGDVVFDIGAEHGWISGLIAEVVGGENMVLVEPSQDLWPNIRLTWEANQFSAPLATVWGFAGLKTMLSPEVEVWPKHAYGDECHDALPYRSLEHHTDSIPTIAIDDLAALVGKPRAITIDVEGAEGLVLSGAMNVLQKDRPLVWVSIHPDLMMKHFAARPEHIFSYMRGLGYSKEHLATDHEEHWFFEPR
jgi:FkbM family methyltransferase